MKGKYYERFFNPVKASATSVGEGRDRRKVKGIIVWKGYYYLLGHRTSQGTYIHAHHGELPNLLELRAKEAEKSKQTKALTRTMAKKSKVKNK